MLFLALIVIKINLSYAVRCLLVSGFVRAFSDCFMDDE